MTHLRPTAERPRTRPGPGADRRSPSRRPESSPVWLATGFALALNGLTLLGVLVWHWPPGNVYLLFWVENAVLGLVTLPRVATARGSDSTGTARINGRPASASLLTLFFLFHYGLFCVVHLVFTAFVAYRVGFSLNFWFLGLPALLILLRYSLETALTWFGPGGQRHHVSPGQAMIQPYPRIAVLHLAVLASFALTLNGLDSWTASPVGAWVVDDLLPRLPEALRTPGTLAVLILLAIKTVVDVITTRRAVTR